MGMLKNVQECVPFLFFILTTLLQNFGSESTLAIFQDPGLPLIGMIAQ